MAFDKAMALPRSDSTQDLRFMDNIVFPNGETMSRPLGEFLFSPMGGQIAAMQSVEETRRARLQMLVKKQGSMAELCQKIPQPRTVRVLPLSLNISPLGVDILSPLGQ